MNCQFFTPEWAALELVERHFADLSPQDLVVEPSVGLGAFALGRTERSTKKEGMVGAGTLGGFNVRDVKSGVEFSIGSGFTQDERTDYWKRRTKLAGLIVKYKYFPTGGKNKPRFPIYLGVRDKRDV